MKAVPYVFFDNRRNFQSWFLQILSVIPADQEVFVLSNATPPIHITRTKNLKFVQLSDLDYLKKFKNFERSYVHLSTHEPEFELSCFERYFALEALMTKLNLDSAWHLDIDVLPTQDLARFNEFELVFSSPYSDHSVVSAHTSKFSISGIRNLTDFLVRNFYTDYLDELQFFFRSRVQRGLSGGVCDMQGLAYWLRTINSNDWLNSFQNRDVEVHINHTLANIDVEFPEINGSKNSRIAFRNGRLQVSSKNSSRVYATLHFQGQFKFLIPYFLRFKILIGSSRCLLYQTKIATKLFLIKVRFLGK